MNPILKKVYWVVFHNLFFHMSVLREIERHLMGNSMEFYKWIFKDLFRDGKFIECYIKHYMCIFMDSE